MGVECVPLPEWKHMHALQLAPSLAHAPTPLAACPPAVHGRPSALESMKLRLQRLSPFKSSSQDVSGSAASGIGASDSMEGAEGAGRGRGSKLRAAGLSLPASGCGMSRRDTAADPAAAGAAAAGDAAGAVQAGGGADSEEGAAQLPSRAFPSDSEDEDEQQQPEAEAASALVDQGAHPQDAAAVAAAAGTAARQQAVEEAADLVGRGSLSFSTGLATGAQQQQQQQAPAQQQVERQLGQQLSFDLEAQQQPAQAARVAVATVAMPHPSSAVFRRCCAGLLPALPWHRASQRRRVSTAVQRR